jgi:hypothetical protein
VSGYELLWAFAIVAGFALIVAFGPAVIRLPPETKRTVEVRVHQNFRATITRPDGQVHSVVDFAAPREPTIWFSHGGCIYIRRGDGKEIYAPVGWNLEVRRVYD